jgi:hypothetical protein
MSRRLVHIHTEDLEDFYREGGDTSTEDTFGFNGWLIITFTRADGHQWTEWRPYNEITWL